MTRRPTSLTLLAVLGGLAGVAFFGMRAGACPFCGTVQNTLGEQLESVHAAVVAKFVGVEAIDAGEGKKAAAGMGKFEIVETLKGHELLKGQTTVQTLYFGEPAPGKLFYIVGMEPANLQWGTPLPITERVQEHLKKLPSLPKDGAKRLEFFLTLLENSETLLANDAYDEFAKAPYETVKAVKDKMPHDLLVAWSQDEKISVSRRRLYLTLLGTCGTMDDVPVLEKMIRAPDTKYRAGLDALLACYINLKGPEGLALIDELLLANKESEYADTYAAVMALRFHATESNVVSRERILQSFRLLLDRPALADLIIPDLARFEDWSAIDKLVKLFKEATEKNNWVRVPVINYLRTCPLPVAKEKLKELEAIDPKAVKRANFFFAPLQDGAPEASPGEKPKTSMNDRDAAPVAQTFAAPIPPPDETEGEEAVAERGAAERGAARAALGAPVVDGVPSPPEVEEGVRNRAASLGGPMGLSLVVGLVVATLAWALLPRGKKRSATPQHFYWML